MFALVLKLNDCKADHFHLLDPKNNLIMDGVFTKLVYVMPHYTINSIYIDFPIVNPITQYKNCVIFDPVRDKAVIQATRKLEYDLLHMYGFIQRIDKKPNYSLAQMFSHGKSKFFNVEHTSQFLLKLSGIWESESEYGITFKIVDGQAIKP